ncbi:MAG: RNA polymerase sigma factor [Steroidobacteraceae bacterium]
MSVRTDELVAELGARDDGEPLSVRELIRRHHQSLMHLLRRRIRIADDAADVAQDAYIRMLRYEGARNVRYPASLLFRIAINLAKDRGRSDQVRHVHDQCELNEIEVDSGLADPERELSAQQDLEKVYAVIDQLPPKCRKVFLLSRMNEMTYPQIAVHCGISVKMVEKHISHALAICTAKLAG